MKTNIQGIPRKKLLESLDFNNWASVILAPKNGKPEQT
jgi:hypothetical protein